LTVTSEGWKHGQRCTFTPEAINNHSNTSLKLTSTAYLKTTNNDMEAFAYIKIQQNSQSDNCQSTQDHKAIFYWWWRFISTVLTTYNGTRIQQLGFMTLPWRSKNYMSACNVYIAETNGPDNLEFMSCLELWMVTFTTHHHRQKLPHEQSQKSTNRRSGEINWYWTSARHLQPTSKRSCRPLYPCTTTRCYSTTQQQEIMPCYC
jgi:hypothetical protein